MLSPGQRLDGYEIIGLLGEGGMGSVYEATQLSLKRTVALKVIDRQLSSDATFTERFRREGEIQAQLDHPNIVPVYQAGESPEGLFIAMRIIRGTTLKEMIYAGNLTDRETVEMLGPIADALDVAHGDALIHRDVKPQNILVDDRQRPFLADFGLTKRSTSAGLTRTGQFVGTFDYVSPEQILGEEATAASDLYSFAAVVFECLAGVPPFVRPNDAALLYAHVNDKPPDLRQFRPDLPKSVAKDCRRGLAKDPDARYESASDLIASIELAIDGAGRAARRSSLEKRERREQETDPSPGRDDGQQATAPDQPNARAAVGATAADASQEQLSPRSDSATAEQRGKPEASEPADPSRRDRLPAPASSTTASRRRRLVLGLSAGTLALLGVLAGLITAGTFDSGSTRGSTAAISASASVNPAGEWQPIGGVQAERGLDAGLTDPAALRSATPRPLTLVLGSAPRAGNRLLINPSFSKTIPAKERQPKAVKLAGGDALRYAVRTLGTAKEQVVIFAVPTGRTVINVICRRVAAGSAATDISDLKTLCWQAASTLRIEPSARRESVQPDPKYATALNRSIGRMNSRVARYGSALRRAKSSGAQAAAARELSDAYAAAAISVSRTSAPQRATSANSSLVSGLRRCRDAYTSLGRAAANESAGGYDSSRASVTSSQRALNRAFNELRLLGYRPKG